MLYRNLIGIAIISIALSMACEAAAASEYVKYPNLKGQWSRFDLTGIGGQPSFDQTRLWGLGQQAPLIPEYQAKAEASVADQAAGGQGGDGGFACRPYGMPRMMNAYSVIELIVMPELYMLSADGRLMPARKDQPAPDLGYFKALTR